jgi:hypothetical protein
MSEKRDRSSRVFCEKFTVIARLPAEYKVNNASET